MLIQLEPHEQHSIQGYDAHSVTLKNGQQFHQNLLIMPDQIITPWPVDDLASLSIEHLKSVLAGNPEIILIGHNAATSQQPHDLLAALSQQRIGMECLSIGAACRTFNVLLSEQRKVVLGLLFNQKP